MPSDVAGSWSASPSSSCTKKPPNVRDGPFGSGAPTTTPSTTTRWPTSGDASPLPCTSWIIRSVAGSGSGSPPPPPVPLSVPNELVAGPVQVPSIFCRDRPTGVALGSETPMSAELIPSAAPPTAAKVPS